jgi:hypothetical protein
MSDVDNNWSPEFTAYTLTLEVMKSEADAIKAAHTDQSERQYMLDTYAECLAAVQGKRQVAKNFVRAG